MAVQCERQNVDRKMLYEEIPLDAPYKVGLFLGDICNLRCNYCVHSLPNVQEIGLTREFMKWSTFINICNGLQAFPSKIKTVMIMGQGEPTLHPQLTQIIQYLKEIEVAEKIILVTNGIAFTTDLIDELIAVGVDRIELSIQGNDEKDYFRNAGRKIDYEKFFENLKYLYQNKKQCEIYLQSLETNFENMEARNIFFQKYETVCDKINVAPTLPLDDEVDYSFIGDVDKIRKQNWTEICPQIFYQIHFLSDGTIIPCCHSLRGRRLNLGNINENDLVNVWGGGKRKELLLTQLRFGRSEMEACKTCMSPNMCNSLTDNLDNKRTELCEKLGGI